MMHTKKYYALNGEVLGGCNAKFVLYGDILISVTFFTPYNGGRKLYYKKFTRKQLIRLAREHGLDYMRGYVIKRTSPLSSKVSETSIAHYAKEAKYDIDIFETLHKRWEGFAKENFTEHIPSFNEALEIRLWGERVTCSD